MANKWMKKRRKDLDNEICWWQQHISPSRSKLQCGKYDDGEHYSKYDVDDGVCIYHNGSDDYNNNGDNNDDDNDVVIANDISVRVFVI